ncbi:MAG TPA: histidine phosphatase family protein [Acetobacteraceae bacterium]|nr:histidine phosphatase family protein [Acetobacteraceae bacterium]
MHQLLLLRHAKSAWDDATLADRDRPLNARGRRAASVMRQVMRDLGLIPDVILVSSAKRTLETLEALEPWDDTPLVESLDALYLATGPQLLSALQMVAETVRSVLLIGHNPGLHQLALTLADIEAADSGGQGNGQGSGPGSGLAKGFPTAALAEFVVPGPWRRLDRGGGRLVRFITPRAMEAAG